MTRELRNRIASLKETHEGVLHFASVFLIGLAVSSLFIYMLS